MSDETRYIGRGFISSSGSALKLTFSIVGGHEYVQKICLPAAGFRLSPDNIPCKPPPPILNSQIRHCLRTLLEAGYQQYRATIKIIVEWCVDSVSRLSRAIDRSPWSLAKLRYGGAINRSPNFPSFDE
jgi:hypothetical protein